MEWLWLLEGGGQCEVVLFLQEGVPPQLERLQPLPDLEEEEHLVVDLLLPSYHQVFLSAQPLQVKTLVPLHHLLNKQCSKLDCKQVCRHRSRDQGQAIPNRSPRTLQQLMVDSSSPNSSKGSSSSVLIIPSSSRNSNNK